MSTSKGIVYEKHPVSRERKTELRAQGLKIVDLAYKPADAKSPERIDVSTIDSDKQELPPTDPPKRRGRPPKAEG